MTWRLVIGGVVLLASTVSARAASADGAALGPAARDDLALQRAVLALRRVGVDAALPQVVMIDPAQNPGLPLSGKVAFRLRDKASGTMDRRIYVNRASRMYRLAVDDNHVGVAMFAASLVHELAHGNGAGEPEAYAAEAAFLRRYLGTQNLRTEDRENIEFNLVHVDDLQRIEAHRRHLADARTARRTP